ncbi:MAG: ABC transporter permease [Burkholderiales bacterium]
MATLRVALRALRANRLRSALTMLGIIIGVAAVITMLAVGEGAQARVKEQIASLGSNVMILTTGAPRTTGVRGAAGSGWTINEDDAEAIEREIPGIVAAPSLRTNSQIVFGNQNWSSAIYGVPPDYFEARSWKAEFGRVLEDADMQRGTKVAVIGATVAKQLFGDGDAVDQIIRIKKVPFVVIGVLEKKGQSMQGTDQDDAVFVPMSTARSRITGNTQAAKSKAVQVIWLKAADGEDLKAMENEVRGVLRQRHRLQEGQDDDFYLRNLSEVLAAQEASSQILTYLLLAVASVSLVVGGIGIMNIMLVSVTERTREIGLRMAVGARRRDILTQFLVEAVALSVIGGIIGILLGVGAAYAVGHFAGWRTEITPAPIVLAVGFAAAVGIFFGFYPARKAAQLEPIEALRYE